MWKKLDAFFKSLDSNVDEDKYLMLCEQLGETPDPDKLPMDFSDFPSVVQTAVHIYNSLGDRVAADIGYLGKEYSKLEYLLKVNLVTDFDLEYTLEIIEWLDRRAIKKSSDNMKKERDKLKRKSHGK